MTILEELIDISLKACEKSRAADCQRHHHARGAALLATSGKVEECCAHHSASASELIVSHFYFERSTLDVMSMHSREVATPLNLC